MEHSSTPNITNSANSTPDQPNPNNPYYQGILPSQYPTHLTHTHYGHPMQPQYSPNLPQLGIPPNFQHFPYPQMVANFHGAPYGEARNIPQPPGLSGSGRGSGSLGDESASPLVAASQVGGADTAAIEELSDTSPEEDTRRGRHNWSQEDNERLVSAWLSNSNDPVEGNGKKSAQYWKQVADEYNGNSPRGEKRTATQCKSHWTKGNKLVVQFNGCYIELQNIYASGQSEDMLIEKTHAKWKKDYEAKHPFPLEYWWRMVKVQAKWCQVYKPKNKRTKISASVTLNTSSTQESEETEYIETPRPEGNKGAKAKRKAKERGSSSQSNLVESCDKFNDATAQKAAVILTMAEATRENARAKRESAIARREMAQAEKMKQYVKLVTCDTSGFSEAQLERHEKALAHFSSVMTFNEDN